MNPSRRLELLLFFACWFAFAYFNQGGGWNQNSRFAEIRAMAEEGRFPIDNFLVYQRTAGGDEIERLPVDHAEFTRNGERLHLCWVDGNWNLTPMGDTPPAEGVKPVAMIPEVLGQEWGSASGDVAYVSKTGHFHPNKPPGTSFLGLPAYWITLQIERALGINPDHWWALNVNMWLTTVFSVGLISALGCVLFFRLAREMAGGASQPALLATVAYAFGTTFFPFATILFDHALTASLFIATLYFLRLKPMPVLAGACAGLAVVTNYVAGGAVIAFGLYALLAGGLNWRRAILFSLGGIPMAVLLFGYHWLNFGSPLALANDFQNPIFKDAAGALGMFGMPNPYVVGLLIASPYRGIFLLSPILILGLVGWVIWLREKTWVAEARLGIVVFGFFFFINTTFNGYHAGFSAGPRYLVPGIPFIALATVVAFARWRSVWAAIPAILLALSVGQQFLLVATDAQNSLAVGGHARIDDEHRKDDFYCSIVFEYAAPLFFTEQMGPLLRQMRDIKLEQEEAVLRAEEPNADIRAKKLSDTRAELDAAIQRGDRSPFLLAAIRGPVSVNPVAAYDGLLGYGLYPLGSAQSVWSSFNAGELIFPQSRWSVVPLLLVSGGLLVMAYRGAREKSVAQ